jgi:hypothetical protein
VTEWIHEGFNKFQLLLFCQFMQGVDIECKECVLENFFFYSKLRRDSKKHLHAECAYRTQGVHMQSLDLEKTLEKSLRCFSEGSAEVGCKEYTGSEIE